MSRKTMSRGPLRSSVMAHQDFRSNRFGELLYKKPLCGIASTLVIVFSLLLLIPLFGPLQISMSPSTWYDKSDIITKRQFAFDDLYGRFAEDYLQNADSVEVRTAELDTFTLVWEVENDGDSILSDDKIRMMRR